MHDLNELRARDGEVGGVVMPHKFVKKIPTDRQTMLAVPIRNPKNPDTNQGRLLGTLAVDSATPLAETGWAEKVWEWGLDKGTAAQRLAMWARVVGGLLS